MNSSLAPVQILVISLERSIERRERVKEQLNKISIQWDFLNAVDGYALPKMPASYDCAKVKRLQGYELTPGEVGCFLSHIKAWEACIAAQRPTLVFEDDFILGPNFEAVLLDLLEIPNEWDLVRLSGIYKTKDSLLVQRGLYDLVQNLGDPCGTACYLLNPHAAQVLINNAGNIYQPVDHYLEHFKKHHLACLAAKPYPVELAQSKSTITDRPGRAPIKGYQKLLRSIYRLIDRKMSPSPWFPKD